MLQKFNLLIIFLFSGLKIIYAQFPEQDCLNAINVCSNSYSQQNAYNGFGSEQEIAVGSGCLLNGEVNSVWYIFTVYSSGQLIFQISPQLPNLDYDWALYDLTDTSCASISNGNILPVRCNYSSTLGNTGLSAGYSNTSSASNEPNQCSPIEVLTTETYALLVNNFTGSTAGYDLTFAGSASIGDNNPPELDSLSTRSRCNPMYIELYFDEPIRCNSISSNGSDFIISGPAAFTVIAASPLNCVEGFTSALRISLNTKITVTGNYTISIQTGSDGNSIMDFCGNESLTGENILLHVQFIGPNLTIAGTTNSSCTVNDGAIDLSVTNGTAPFTYSWNTSPAQTIQDPVNVGAGTWIGYATDANGCLDGLSATVANINAPALSLASSTGISCYGTNNGTATVTANGGDSPYTYSWNSSPPQTGATATNLPAGNRTVTVTDANSCIATLLVNIPGASALNMQFAINAASCGLADGSATATVTGGAGGYGYSWSTGNNTNTATNLFAGVYQFLVSDANGCMNEQDVIISNVNAPTAFIQSSTPSCGGPTGSGTVNVSGGVSPYSYLWNTNPPQTGTTAINLIPQNYYVTITDNAGCIQIINMKLDSVAPPVVSLVNTTEATCGNADGTAEVSALSGLSPYSYLWNTSPAQTNTHATGLTASIYQVIVNDSIGCTDTLDVTIVYAQPVSSIIGQTVCAGQPFSFTSISNTNPSSWIWNFGDPSSGVLNSASIQNPAHTYSTGGSYPVTLYLNGNCMPDTVVQTFIVNPLPLASFITSPEVLSTQTSVSFFYSGSDVMSYNWDLGNGSTSTFINPLENYPDSGTYRITLIVTDANGCIDTLETTIDVIKEPQVYLPNAFTPTGNTLNTTYRVFGEGVSAIEFRVYSLWGDLVYDTHDINQAMNIGWDGKYSGKHVQQGVYAYVIKVEFITGKRFERNGTITVIH